MLLRIAGSESSLAVATAILLFWAPLPAGSVTPGGQLVFRLAALGLLLWAMSLLPRLRHGHGRLAVMSLAGIGLLGLVQSVPWPAGVTELVSPRHFELAVQAAQVLGRPLPSFVPMSLDPTVARSAALSWLAAAALLMVAMVVGRSFAHRRWMLGALVGATLVQLVWGLARLHVVAPEGLASVVLRPEGRLRGTFANPNHLSLLFEIGMAVVAAWVWLEVSRLASGRFRRWPRAVVPLLLWLVLLFGVVLTGSRAGLAAAAVGTVAQVSAVLITSRRRSQVWAATACLVAVLGTLGALAGKLEIRRYQTASLYESNLRSRLMLTSPALELWQRFPITGTGLGSFEDAFPAVVPAELAPVLWNRAHNDPLELLVTGGLVGLALGMTALAFLVLSVRQGMRRDVRPEDRAVAVAAVGALSMVGLHELFDFGLVMPANTLALVLVLGSAAAVGRGGPRRSTSAAD